MSDPLPKADVGTPFPPKKQQFFECNVRSRSTPGGPVSILQMSGASVEDVIQQLLKQGFIVVSVKPMKGSRDHLQKALSFGSGAPRGSFFFMKKVSVRELIFFGVQLGTLIKAGIPLLRSLEIVGKGTSNPYFRDVLQRLTKRISEGSSFAVALRECSDVFPWIWVNLVEVGETTGKLPECLEEISRYQEAAARIQGKIITAFFYPGILSLAVTGALTFLMLFIVPKFAAIFAEQNAELPTLTRIVVTISNLLRFQAPLLLLFIFGIAVAFFFLKKNPKSRLLIDHYFLGTPLFGELSLQVAVVRFSRSLGTLLRSGIQILQALEISGRLVENSYLEAHIKQVAQAVKGGQGLGLQLEARKIFPVFMTQLLSTGEETGQMENFLAIIANYYEETVDRFLARLTVLLEPILLIFMGGVIGTVVISMFLPIIELSMGGKL